MWRRLKCLFGFHVWRWHYEVGPIGHSMGYRCVHCGKWHNAAIQRRYFE